VKSTPVQTRTRNVGMFPLGWPPNLGGSQPCQRWGTGRGWGCSALWSNLPTFYEAGFVPMFFCQKLQSQTQTLIREKLQKKHFCMKKLLVQCRWNWDMESISSTLYAHIFVRIFWQSQNVTRKSCRNDIRTKNL